MSSLRFALGLAALLLALVSQAACSGADEPNESVNAVPTHDRESLDGLGVEGYLRDFENCLYLETGTSAIALSFPTGYSRNGESLVDADASAVATVGDYVEAGGTISTSGDSCVIPFDDHEYLLVGEINPIQLDE